MERRRGRSALADPARQFAPLCGAALALAGFFAYVVWVAPRAAAGLTSTEAP